LRTSHIAFPGDKEFKTTSRGAFINPDISSTNKIQPAGGDSGVYSGDKKTALRGSHFGLGDGKGDYNTFISVL
jgi:hypothetical protein